MASATGQEYFYSTEGITGHRHIHPAIAIVIAAGDAERGAPRDVVADGEPESAVGVADDQGKSTASGIDHRHIRLAVAVEVFRYQGNRPAASRKIDFFLEGAVPVGRKHVQVVTAPGRRHQVLPAIAVHIFFDDRQRIQALADFIDQQKGAVTPPGKDPDGAGITAVYGENDVGVAIAIKIAGNAGERSGTRLVGVSIFKSAVAPAQKDFHLVESQGDGDVEMAISVKIPQDWQ